MKPTSTPRTRRRASRDPGTPQTEQRKEPAFFGAPAESAFFPPTGKLSLSPEAPAAEEKEKVARAPEEKQEEPLQRAPEEKREELKRAPEEQREETISRAPEEKQEEKISRKAEGPAAGDKTTDYVRDIAGRGEPLPAREKEWFGERMGHDFGNVRVHTGPEAATSARDAGAKAYTWGAHVVFGEGRYRPETGEGRHLLAHELAHVAQNDPSGRRSQDREANAAGASKTESVKSAEPATIHAGTVRRGFWSDAWDAVKGVGSAVLGGLESVANWGWDVLKSAGAWVWDLVTWLPQRVWALLRHVGSGIVGILSHLWSGLVGALGHVWDGLTGLLGWLGDGIEGLFGWVWRGLQGGASWAWKLLQGDFSGFWDGIAGAFSWLGDGVGGLLDWGWTGLEGLVVWGARGIAGLARWCWEGFLGGLAWIGRFVAKIFDIVGAGELWTLFGNVVKGFSTRSMTDVEIAEARRVYADSIAYWQVRIDEMSLIAQIGAWFEGTAGMGVTTAHTINFNRAVSCAPGNSDMAWLVHELGHVAQYTAVGLQYLGEAIHAQATGGYVYGGGAALVGKDLSDFNREQQCDILKHFYQRVLNGSDPNAAEYVRMRDQAVAGRF